MQQLRACVEGRCEREVPPNVTGGLPHLAEEWVHELNGERTPDNVSYGSTFKAWWRCASGHTWQTALGTRTKGRACPYCCRQSWGVSEANSLASRYPAAEVAAQWHPTLNGAASPEGVRCSSHRKPWWLCPQCSHTWRAVVKTRTLGGSGCPGCAGEAATERNSVAALNPALAAERDGEANGSLTAGDVTRVSARKVGWKCASCGHRWRATVSSRSRGGSCPHCARRRVDVT
eukprot:tig00000802_g4308.t1